MDDCTELAPFSSCDAAWTYIYTSWALGALLLIIIVIFAIVCTLLVARLRKTLRDAKHTKSREQSGVEIRLEDGSTEQNHKPPNNNPTTLADKNYETVVEIESQTSPIHIDSVQNYEYVTHQVSGEANWMPGNNTAGSGNQTEQPLPYEDFVHGEGQADTAIPQQRGSKVAVESNDERYSRLIHLPELTKTVTSGPNHYNTKPSVGMNRHSSHLLSSPNNEQEQYATLGGNNIPPPLLPPPFDFENDPSFIELKFNTQGDARESYYGNISRKSVNMAEVAQHDNEEVFYCNTVSAPEVQHLEHTLSVEEIEGSEALYEEALPLSSQPQELYANVKRS